MLVSQRPIIVLLCIWFLLTACSLLGTGEAPNPDLLPSEATAASLPPGVLFVDDFSNPLSGWDVRDEGQIITDYHEGSFVIFVGVTDYMAWSKSNHHLSDVVIEVDAQVAAGPDDNLHGVFCRYVDRDNFYRFVISGDGHAGITKRVNGEVVVISDEFLTEVDVVNRGWASNHIQAQCVGEILSLIVNGKLIAQASDPDFAEGDIGLLAATGDHPGVEVHFTNFIVREP